MALSHARLTRICSLVRQLPKQTSRLARQALSVGQRRPDCSSRDLRSRLSCLGGLTGIRNSRLHGNPTASPRSRTCSFRISPLFCLDPLFRFVGLLFCIHSLGTSFLAPPVGKQLN